MFLTKKFLESQECTFQATLAVHRHVETRGIHKHDVLTVLLESSLKVPKYLPLSKCVYAWKYKMLPEEQLFKIYRKICGGECCIYWADILKNENVYARSIVNASLQAVTYWLYEEWFTHVHVYV